MDKSKLQNYISQGLSQREVAELEKTSQTKIRYWLKKHNLKTVHERRTWTDEQFVSAVESSEYVSDVIRKLGLTLRPGNYETVKRYVKKFGLNTDHFIGNGKKNNRGGTEEIPLSELFVKNCNHTRGIVKKRVIKYNLLPYRCSICSIHEWKGQRLSLVLDHINGTNDDHRLENLRFLCPNCNSLQPTFCGKNKRKTRDE